MLNFLKEDKPKRKIKLQYVRYLTTHGDEIAIINYPVLEDQNPGYWTRLTEYVDKERTEVYTRHIIYLKNIVYVKYKLEDDFKVVIE
jgi:hypothetical protein